LRPQWIVLWLAIACVLLACSRQESGWRSARNEDNVPAYETYLEQFPAGAHAAEARTRIRELREEQEWARASRLETPEAYQRYLGSYPEGRYATAAHEHLSDIVLARAPSADRPYLVQLGAYSNEGAARAVLARLKGDHADLLEGLQLRVLPPAAGAPRLWRLRAGSLGETAARGLCGQLAARGVDCAPLKE